MLGSPQKSWGGGTEIEIKEMDLTDYKAERKVFKDNLNRGPEERKQKGVRARATVSRSIGIDLR